MSLMYLEAFFDYDIKLILRIQIRQCLPHQIPILEISKPVLSLNKPIWFFLGYIAQKVLTRMFFWILVNSSAFRSILFQTRPLEFQLWMKKVRPTYYDFFIFIVSFQWHLN